MYRDDDERERWAVPTHTHTHIDGKGKKDVTAARSGRRLAQSRGNNAITFGSWEKPRPNRVRAALGVCVCIRHTHKGTWLTCFDCLFQKTNIDSRAQHRQTDEIVEKGEIFAQASAKVSFFLIWEIGALYKREDEEELYRIDPRYNRLTTVEKAKENNKKSQPSEYKKRRKSWDQFFIFYSPCEKRKRNGYTIGLDSYIVLFFFFFFFSHKTFFFFFSKEG